jgi:ribosomal 30S subunit maturation factor RimM
MPANDVWVMKTEQGEIPLPVIDDVIISTDISKKTITVYMMDGLLDLVRQHAKEDDEY